jgi:hypothetical protein
MDPFMWSAYEQLCELGADLEASRFFGAASYFNSVGAADDVAEDFSAQPEAMDEGNKGRRRFGDEQFDREDNNAEDRSTDGTFATPEPPPHAGLATPKSVLTSASRPLSYKTPTVNSSNDNNFHTATVVKKTRVAGDIGAPARQRKAHRRPLVDSDEKYRAHARLSFSAAGIDDSPLVRKERDLVVPSPLA